MSVVCSKQMKRTEWMVVVYWLCHYISNNLYHNTKKTNTRPKTCQQRIHASKKEIQFIYNPRKYSQPFKRHHLHLDSLRPLTRMKTYCIVYCRSHKWWPKLLYPKTFKKPTHVPCAGFHTCSCACRLISLLVHDDDNFQIREAIVAYIVSKWTPTNLANLKPPPSQPITRIWKCKVCLLTAWL